MICCESVWYVVSSISKATVLGWTVETLMKLLLLLLLLLRYKENYVTQNAPEKFQDFSRNRPYIIIIIMFTNGNPLSVTLLSLLTANTIFLPMRVLMNIAFSLKKPTILIPSNISLCKISTLLDVCFGKVFDGKKWEHSNFMMDCWQRFQLVTCHNWSQFLALPFMVWAYPILHVLAMNWNIFYFLDDFLFYL